MPSRHSNSPILILKLGILTISTGSILVRFAQEYANLAGDRCLRVIPRDSHPFPIRSNEAGFSIVGMMITAGHTPLGLPLPAYFGLPFWQSFHNCWVIHLSNGRWGTFQHRWYPYL
jgi:hypothetical protein